MTQIDNDKIDNILNICNNTLKEMEKMKSCVDFLIQEFKNNKHYFEEDGNPTIEDVIKTAFEFGWASCNNFKNQDN